MKWSSVIEESDDLDAALGACIEKTRAALETTPDLAMVFVSPRYEEECDRVGEVLMRDLSPRRLIGCSAEGQIGNGREIEGRRSIALTAASLPDIPIETFHIVAGDYPSMDAPPEEWRARVGVPHTPEKDPPSFLLLAEPFSSRIETLTNGLDYAFPDRPKIGGLASGGTSPGDNFLYLGENFLREGTVGFALGGNLEIDTVVAQGCRPIGSPMMVTSCHENVLMGVDGESPLATLDRLYPSLSERDQKLVRHSLFLGIVMDPFKTELGAGDFLIRNIIGADQNRGCLAIGAMIRKGQTVQFHVRDAETSRQDLHAALTRYREKTMSHEPEAGLLFSCLGRGARLYDEPDHDSREFVKIMGEMPLGGFFCNGEIGPIANTTHVHGFTSSFGLVRFRR